MKADGVDGKARDRHSRGTRQLRGIETGDGKSQKWMNLASGLGSSQWSV